MARHALRQVLGDGGGLLVVTVRCTGGKWRGDCSVETQGILLPMQAGDWMLSVEDIKQAGVSAEKRTEKERELRRKVSGHKLLQCAAAQMQH